MNAPGLIQHTYYAAVSSRAVDMEDPGVCDRPCAHLDCLEERGVLPECVVCQKEVESKDLFFLSGSRGWMPSHFDCNSDSLGVIESEDSCLCDLKAGDPVKLTADVEPFYRRTIGELADELIVLQILDDKRVQLKWVGLVPTHHVRRK